MVTAVCRGAAAAAAWLGLRHISSLGHGPWGAAEHKRSKKIDTHKVFATNFISMFDLLLCSARQTGPNWECCLELTAVSGYRMFLGRLQTYAPHWVG